jgi:hypothetical protein
MLDLRGLEPDLGFGRDVEGDGDWPAFALMVVSMVPLIYFMCKELSE